MSTGAEYGVGLFEIGAGVNPMDHVLEVDGFGWKLTGGTGEFVRGVWVVAHDATVDANAQVIVCAKFVMAHIAFLVEDDGAAGKCVCGIGCGEYDGGFLLCSLDIGSAAEAVGSISFERYGECVVGGCGKFCGEGVAVGAVFEVEQRSVRGLV